MTSLRARYASSVWSSPRMCQFALFSATRYVAAHEPRMVGEVLWKEPVETKLEVVY
jgi:hypothetical protein